MYEQLNLTPHPRDVPGSILQVSKLELKEVSYPGLLGHRVSGWRTWILTMEDSAW